MTVIDTQTVDERIQTNFDRKAALYGKHPRYGISLADLERLDNEQQIAELCAKFYKGRYLYDVSAGVWFFYTGLVWQRITNVSEFHNVIARDLMALFTWGASKTIEVHEDKDKASKHYGALMELAVRAGTKRFLEEVTHFLTGLPNMAVDGSAWDAQAHLLVCANMIVDLRTGEEVEPYPEQCLQKNAKADWTGIETPCPLWEDFLNTTFGGDSELIGFLQTAIGYAFTGDIREHKFFLLNGVGRNGKGVMLNTLLHIAGDYGGTFPSGALLDAPFKTNDGPQPALLSLQGKRFVTAAETNEGAKMNSGLVKWITGGDALTARGMYAKGLTTWTPTHKLLLATNAIPRISTETPALWDRVVLLNYPMRFVDEPNAAYLVERKRDPELEEKLKAEASGILAWVVRGAVKWYQQGRLTLPESVKYAIREEKANNEYGDFDKFLEKHCDLAATYTVGATELLNAFNAKMGTRFSAKGFSKIVSAKFAKGRNEHGSYWKGLRLKGGM